MLRSEWTKKKKIIVKNKNQRQIFFLTWKIKYWRTKFVMEHIFILDKCTISKIFYDIIIYSQLQSTKRAKSSGLLLSHHDYKYLLYSRFPFSFRVSREIIKHQTTLPLRRLVPASLVSSREASHTIVLHFFYSGLHSFSLNSSSDFSSSSIFIALHVRASQLIFMLTMLVSGIISRSDFYFHTRFCCFYGISVRSLFSSKGDVVSEASSQIRSVSFNPRGEENWKRRDSKLNCSAACELLGNLVSSILLWTERCITM